MSEQTDKKQREPKRPRGHKMPRPRTDSFPDWGDDVLNVANFLPDSAVNGPGRRAVVWVQGCPFRCPGCWNPDNLQFVRRSLVTVPDLAAHILSLPDIVGVTFSGGDPFAQADALGHLGELLQARGLSVVTFTGYLLENLQAANRADWNRLLAATDLLIDGPFVRRLRTPLPLRGSSNQRLHFLTERLRDHADLSTLTGDDMEVHIAPGQVQLTGFPDFDLDEFRRRLAARGIVVERVE